MLQPPIIQRFLVYLLSTGCNPINTCFIHWRVGTDNQIWTLILRAFEKRWACTLKFRRQVSFYWTYTHIGQSCLVQFHEKRLHVGPVSVFDVRGAFDYMQCEKLFLYCDCPTIRFTRVCLEVCVTWLIESLRYQSRFLSSNETLMQINGCSEGQNGSHAFKLNASN